MELTQKRLKELLHYNPLTGGFIWKVKRSNVKAGTKAGCFNKKYRYIFIGVDGTLYSAHRLAFLYVEGSFPKGDVDHIDHVRENNKWNNIRHATRTMNARNTGMSSRNTSGFTGVSWNRSKRKWAVMIQVDKRNINLGAFETNYAACCCRHAANVKYGFHANHGKTLK